MDGASPYESREILRLCRVRSCVFMFLSPVWRRSRVGDCAPARLTRKVGSEAWRRPASACGRFPPLTRDLLVEGGTENGLGPARLPIRTTSGEARSVGRAIFPGEKRPRAGGSTRGPRALGRGVATGAASVRLDPLASFGCGKTHIARRSENRRRRAPKRANARPTEPPNSTARLGQTQTDNFIALGDRGVVYNHKRDYDRAIVDLIESIRLEPGFANSSRRRSVAHIDCAIVDLHKAIVLGPDRGETFASRGDAIEPRTTTE
jgi:hypothetical protein